MKEYHSKIFTFNKRIENLYKSYFKEFKNINLVFDSNEIRINVTDENNHDSASVEAMEINDGHKITFWDGYSHLEIIETRSEKESSKVLKRFMKKLLKILSM